jgi:GT2 family glycosyltransferase
MTDSIQKSVRIKLSIVILNWNGVDFLRRFLPSIVQYSNYEWAEIVVADNGSTDNSREVVENEFPTVKYLQLDKNHGFAEGYNQALRQINAQYYLLLNSDVEVTENWLTPLIEIMDNDQSVGACQPKILSLNHRDRFEYAGAAGGFIDRFGYPFCRGRIMNVCETDHGQYDQTIPVFWATGACIMVRASVWQECNGFDSDFWAHMEEIDLCWRMKNRGYLTFFCPESTVYHLGGGSLSYENPLKIYLNFRNNLFLLYKNLPEGKLFSTLFSRMVLDGVAAIQFLLTGQAKAFQKVLAAHFDFYRALPQLRKKRKKLLKSVTLNKHPEIYKRSLIWDFFIHKKKKFSNLQF